MSLQGKIITLGICACSPAYKAMELISSLKKEGAEVHVMLTPNAHHFTSVLMLQREAGNAVQTDQFALPEQFDPQHKSLSRASDLLLLAPLSANTLGKAANGIADNLLTTTILSVNCPIVAATHINPFMYANKAVQKNLAQLKEDGVIFVESDAMKPGMFPSLPRIIETVKGVFA